MSLYRYENKGHASIIIMPYWALLGRNEPYTGMGGVIGSAIGRGDQGACYEGYTARNVSRPSQTMIAHMVLFVNITSKLPDGDGFSSHKCAPASNTPAVTCAPASRG